MLLLFLVWKMNAVALVSPWPLLRPAEARSLKWSETSLSSPRAWAASTHLGGLLLGSTTKFECLFARHGICEDNQEMSRMTGRVIWNGMGRLPSLNDDLPIRGVADMETLGT